MGGASVSNFLTAVPSQRGFSMVVNDNSVDLHDYNLQQLDYSDSTGTFGNTDTRYADSVDYIAIPDGAYYVSCNAVFSDGLTGLWCAYLYDADKNYLYSDTSSNRYLDWAEYDTKRTIPTTAKYIRFIVRNGSRSAFDLSDLTNATAHFM